jgi:Rv0078B-related antitoxin
LPFGTRNARRAASLAPVRRACYDRAQVSTAAERMRMALELSELAEAVMRENLRRRYPDAGPLALEALLTEWFATRPGAEHGDAEGRAIDPSRFG